MKIRVYVNVDGGDSDDTVEIPDEEWAAMSEKEREDRLDDEAREYMGNCVDFGAHKVVDETNMVEADYTENTTAH